MASWYHLACGVMKIWPGENGVVINGSAGSYGIGVKARGVS
jgi:hypothetical protein